MAYVDFVMVLHRNAKRDYVQRVIEYDKSECAFIAKKWGEDYWDGDHCFGYGGYRYDGRWRIVAENMAQYYGLKNGDRILDVGCVFSRDKNTENISEDLETSIMKKIK